MPTNEEIVRNTGWGFLIHKPTTQPKEVVENLDSKEQLDEPEGTAPSPPPESVISE